jgi:hypothetical protein
MHSVCVPPLNDSINPSIRSSLWVVCAIYDFNFDHACHTLPPLSCLRGALQFRENLLTLGTGGVKVANHVESTLRKVITLTTDDLLE